MDGDRNFASIGWPVGLPGHNVQHCMTNSPWSTQGVLQQVRWESAAKPELCRGGVLVLDESAVKQAGHKSAGVGRQWNGRLGKVDLSQVGTFLAYANGPVWTWIDGELFLPAHWFGANLAAERQRLGIPPERTFQTKVELGWQMIQRADGRPPLRGVRLR
jgi:SRSO17 transposase